MSPRIDGKMVEIEIRFGTYRDIAEWPCLGIREWGRHTAGQMIAWRGGLLGRGNYKSIKILSNGSSGIMVFGAEGTSAKSHSPPTRVRSKYEAYYGSTALHFLN